MDVEKIIAESIDTFTGKVNKRFGEFTKFSTESLEWLIYEHYQFSKRSCGFLISAAKSSEEFDTDAVNKELQRNIGEESDHVNIYRAALAKMGCDVNNRKKCPATDDFLDEFGKLFTSDSSFALGAIYVSEATAIFELTLLRAAAKEFIARRGLADKSADLIAFYDMHLTGVEQSHRDELGIFLRGVPPNEPLCPRKGERPTVKPDRALSGGRNAVELMERWWHSLCDTVMEKSGIDDSSV